MEKVSIELDRRDVRFDAPTPVRRLVRRAFEGLARWTVGRSTSSGPEGVFRFSPPEDPQYPFPAFVEGAVVRKASKESARTTVLFAQPRGRGGRYAAARIPLDPSTSLYGTGEQAGSLLRNGKTIECWNWDRVNYDDQSPSLYQSHPFVLGVRSDGSAVGLVAETTYRLQIDLRDGVTFRALGPPFAVRVIEREQPAEVVEALSQLTGRMPMPPKWALGYQQCRWSYRSEARVREIADEFRKREIPCDVIWMDIDYMHGFRVFTFDPETFPAPAKLNAYLHQRGFRAVWMLDPGIKAEGGYSIFDEGCEGDHFVKTEEGNTFIGPVWPGDCAFPDFTRAQTRVWWSEKVKAFMNCGADGLWNDMNEPSVFRPGRTAQTMPDTNLHNADSELGGPDRHARYHNIYGMQMVRATREGLLSAAPGRRPFVLSRANFLGGHRYAAAWTGDNASDWRHLAWSIPMSLSLGLCGQPFSGPDIGGFAGDADGPLFARWMGIGSLLAFSRGHSISGSRDHEPWSFGPEVEDTCRAALQRRMRLLPYIYTCFYEASVFGRPIVAPVFFADPSNPNLRGAEDAFLLGRDILVQASVRPDEPPGPCPLPGWRRFDPVPLVGSQPQELPHLYLRPGAIVPMGPVMQYVDEVPIDPLTLLVHLDAGGRAEGMLYEDAGEGFGHLEEDYRHTSFEALLDADGTVSTRQVAVMGARPAESRTVRVESLG